jgi:hypothetical protein
MFKRRRFKQSVPLKERLVIWTKEVMARANSLPPGQERDDLLKEARQADTAAHLDDIALSPMPIRHRAN